MLGPQQRVIRLNPQARAAGLRLGMSAGSARAICPQLHSLQRQPALEQDVLHSLAVWALQFSSRVSVSDADGLLIEIGGSLRLFGGLETLRPRIEQGLAELGYSAGCGVAPNPRGAEVLARAQQPQAAMDVTQLRRLIQPLSLQHLAWDARTQQRLNAVGVSTIGQCLALPRDGFRRRYGARHLLDLDRLGGHAADPRPPFSVPPTFERSLDVIGDMTDFTYLRPGFEHLFQLLQAELRGRDCGVQQLQIEMLHASQAPSTFEIGLQSPGSDAQHWLTLLEEHVQRRPLAAPVRAIRLRAQNFCEGGRRQQDLWQTHTAEQRQAMLERLTARLGSCALYALNTTASHCPELASQRADPGRGRDTATDTRLRPIWLLAEPQEIDFSQLRLCSGAERLESGWWVRDCRRDYYRARDARNRWVWVFRDHRQPERWYVHGYFA